MHALGLPATPHTADAQATPGAASAADRSHPVPRRESSSGSAGRAAPHRAASTLRQPLSRTKVMVVDAQPTSRSLSCLHLRDMGIAQITQCSRPADVRLALERSHFGIVLCNVELTDAEVGWQDLFDELRREGLLPHSTVLFIVTAEATYAKVREAAEASLDGYLLRPYNAATLESRLKQAWQRKQELAPLLDAMLEGRDEEALAWCCECVRGRRKHALYAARMACELLLKLDRPQEAIEFCQALPEGLGGDWASLNVVRALQSRGEIQRARRQCDELVSNAAHNADAHDLHAQLLSEVGDIVAALEAARKAVALTPGCVLRAQSCGTLAFYAGDTASAQQMLTRAASLGLHSRLFDALTLALLGLTQFDLNDGKALMASRSSLSIYRQRHAESLRLVRFENVLISLRHLQLREIEPAMAVANDLAGQTLEDNFDLEAAVLTLALWSRLPSRELEAGALEKMVRSIGLRHGSTRAAHEAMRAAARQQAPMQALLQSTHREASELAEHALAESMAGKALQAVRALVEHGALWRNAKLLEMSALVARRYAAAVGEEGAALADKAAGLLPPLSHSTTPIAGLRRTRRQAAGLIVRR